MKTTTEPEHNIVINDRRFKVLWTASGPLGYFMLERHDGQRFKAYGIELKSRMRLEPVTAV